MATNIEDAIVWLLTANVHLFCTERSTFDNDNVDRDVSKIDPAERANILQLVRKRGAYRTFDHLVTSAFQVASSYLQSGSEDCKSDSAGYSTDIGMPIASSVGELCDMAITNKNCAVLVNLAEFRSAWQQVFSYFDKRCKATSDAMRSVTSPRAVCPNCMREHENVLSLIIPPGELALPTKSHKCSHCGCEDAYYIFIAPH